MPSPCSPTRFSRSRDKNQLRRAEAADISLVHTCLGTPTLGPALPVDIREPLGGMLTMIREQAQPMWRVELNRLRPEAEMRCMRW
jgi:hypothetical protein